MEYWIYSFNPLERNLNITFANQPSLILSKGAKILSCVIYKDFFELSPFKKQKYEEKGVWIYERRHLNQLEEFLQTLDGINIKLVETDSFYSY